MIPFEWCEPVLKAENGSHVSTQRQESWPFPKFSRATPSGHVWLEPLGTAALLQHQRTYTATVIVPVSSVFRHSCCVHSTDYELCDFI